MALAQKILTGKWAVFGLAVLVVVAYWPVLDAGFSPWDDRLYLSENPLVRGGLSLSGCWRALTSSWENNWSPVFWIFLAAQASLGGADYPQIFHAVSLLLAVLNALLLRHFLIRTGVSGAAALVAAAAFCLHPLRVEAVAWIAAQKHLLAGFWVLVSLILYQEGRTRESAEVKLAAWLAYALALMSSQIAVGFPVFLLAWEAQDARGWRKAFGRAVPYLAAAVAAALVTMWVNWNPAAQTVPWFRHEWDHRIVQGLASLGWLAADIVWPFRLACFYPWPKMVWVFAGAGLLTVAFCLFFVWRNPRRRGLLLPGLAGFFACFLPVSGIVDLPVVFTADRLSYVPGLFLACSLGAILESGLFRGSRIPLFAGALWALVLVPLTFRQATFWKDEKTIVARTLAEYPESIPARINAATLAGMEGRREEAVEKLRRIRETEPLHEVVWANEMTLLRAMNRMDAAVATGALAVSLIPDSPVLRLQHGLDLEAAGRAEEALPHLQRARELRPTSVQPAFYYARALVRLGRSKQAQPILDLLEPSMGRVAEYWEVRAAACEGDGNVRGAQLAREKAAGLKR